MDRMEGAHPLPTAAGDMTSPVNYETNANKVTTIGASWAKVIVTTNTWSSYYNSSSLNSHHYYILLYHSFPPPPSRPGGCAIEFKSSDNNCVATWMCVHRRHPVSASVRISADGHWPRGCGTLDIPPNTLLLVAHVLDGSWHGHVSGGLLYFQVLFPPLLHPTCAVCMFLPS